MAADTDSQSASSHKSYSHDEYFDAFQQFMQTGEISQLNPYLEDSRPAAFLSVYRNGFIRASASALESNFPSLVKLWGEDYFSQVATAYVKLAPPSSATLIGYGFEASTNVSLDENLEPSAVSHEETSAVSHKEPSAFSFKETSAGSLKEPSAFSFVEYLQQDLSEVIAQYPYVPDICRLDQAWLESLNENGESFLTLPVVQELISQGVDLAELPLSLVDSSRIVNLEFDIFELWGQLRFGEIQADQEDQKIELKAHDNSVIFWQMDLQVQAKPLSAVEAVFMQSLKQSADFDTASNQALAKDESFDISNLFAELLTANLLQQ